MSLLYRTLILFLCHLYIFLYIAVGQVITKRDVSHAQAKESDTVTAAEEVDSSNEDKVCMQ